MPVITRLLSFGVTKGLAALLVLALSVIGGVRCGFERTANNIDEERPALICDKAIDKRSTNTRCGYATGLRINPKFLFIKYLEKNIWSHDHLLAPSLLNGSAGGPRAPSTITIA